MIIGFIYILDWLLDWPIWKFVLLYYDYVKLSIIIFYAYQLSLRGSVFDMGIDRFSSVLLNIAPHLLFWKGALYIRENTLEEALAFFCRLYFILLPFPPPLASTASIVHLPYSKSFFFLCCTHEKSGKWAIFTKGAMNSGSFTVWY